MITLVIVLILFLIFNVTAFYFLNKFDFDKKEDLNLDVPKETEEVVEEDQEESA